MSSQIKDNIHTLITTVENTASLMGEKVNIVLKYGKEFVDLSLNVIKDVIDGEDTYTSVVKHGNTVIQTFTETTLTNVLVKSTEFSTGVSAAALCADVPMLAGLGGLYLTWAVPTLDKGFNISGFLKEEYRDFMTDVETGFVDEEIIRGFKAITNIENFTVENHIKTISHIADTFQNISLAELAFAWNKLWYRAAGFEWEPVYNDSGKAMLKYSRQVGSEIINTVAMRNADGYMTICQLDAGYTNIDIDDETGSFVVGYEDGSVKYITGIDTSSGDGAWVIDGNIGTDDNDSILGTLEDDFIYGNGGNDSLNGWLGNDVVHGGDGNDTVKGGEGNDKLYGEDGDDNIFDFEGGDDLLDGGAGNDHLVADAGNDILYGGEGDDVLTGGAGSDVLEGGDGDDKLDGGSGDDILEGGDGWDSYEFVKGDGKDTIIERTDWSWAGIDFLGLVDIRKEDIYFEADGNDVLIKITDSPNDEIRIKDFFEWYRGNMPIETIHFIVNANEIYESTHLRTEGITIQGTDYSDIIYDRKDVYDSYIFGDTIKGLGGDDTIYGLSGNDRLYGGQDNDTLYGETGDDMLYGEEQNDLLFGDVGNDILDGGTGDDKLDGGLGEDILIGGEGDDELEGGKGNDVLKGGDGNDIYKFNLGDGKDAIVLEAGEIGIDKIVFGEGITQDLIHFERENNNLRIQILGTEDELFVQNYFDEAIKPILKYLEFSDLSSIDLSTLELENQGSYIEGSSNYDNLTGTDYADEMHGKLGRDTLQGEAGNDEIYGDEDIDYLYGGEGDDTLEGGTGDDYLYGEKGNDVYKFNLGDGQDVISQTNNSSEELGSDKILFGEGINKENIILTREFDNLYIKIKDTSDSIKLEGYFDNNTDNYGYPVKQLEFADGTRLDITQGLTLEGNDYSELKGTRYDDTLTGGYLKGEAGNDTLQGNNGYDDLYGGEGDDIIEGGKGNDYVYGDKGNDVYKFNLGDGEDVIRQINNALEEFGSDKILFGQGITKENITLSRESSDLYIKIKNTTDSIKLEDYFANNTDENGYPVKELEFADGEKINIRQGLELETTSMNLTGTKYDDILKGYNIEAGEGNDILLGDDGSSDLKGGLGDDIIKGGLGNDDIYSSQGNDIYVFNLGDGQDTIIREPYLLDYGNDYIKFGEGITKENVVITKYFNDLIIEIEGTEDKITVKDYFDAIENESTHELKKIVFDDDSEMYFTQGLDIDGTSSNNQITGTEYDDTISGYQGTDTLKGELGNDEIYGGDDRDYIYGGEGDDIIEAGKGNDEIYGGKGNDIYNYNLGDGEDEIYGMNHAEEELGYDKIVMGEGIDKANMVLSKNTNDLIIRVNDSSYNKIILKDYFRNISDINDYQVKAIEFESGEILDLTVARKIEAVDWYSNIMTTAKYEELTADLPKITEADEINNILFGDFGDDTFVIDDTGTENEIIIDNFNNNSENDKLDITDFGDITKFEDLEITEGSAIVHLGNGQIVHIMNLHPEDLSADDFIFASSKPATLENSNDPLEYIENEEAKAIDGNINILDEDDENMEQAEIKIQNYVLGEDYLLFENTEKIQGVYDEQIGLLTLEGTATKEEYIQALRNVKYLNTSENPSIESREIIFRVSDGDTYSDAVKNIINITSQNDAPVANLDSVTLNKNTMILIDVLSEASDVDGDELSLVEISQAEHGTAFINNGKILYMSNSEYIGQDKMSYTISDGTTNITKDINITVERGYNSAPIIFAITSEVGEDGRVWIQYSAFDQEGDEISIYQVQDGDHGTVAIEDGKIVYTPDENYDGWDTINFTLQDGYGGYITKEYSLKIEGYENYIVGTEEKDNLYGLELGDKIEGGLGIDYIYGEGGDDYILGGENNDNLEGGEGADIIEGGEGMDTVLYTSSNEGVNINLETGVGFGGEAEGDSLISIEKIRASKHDDVLVGSSNRDYIYGNNGDDEIYGGQGNDYIKGGKGADIIDGGEGRDELSYADSNEGVNVNLETGVCFGGEAEGDTLADIEWVYGSRYDDELTGSSGKDYLYGGNGDDIIKGGDSKDNIRGGLGADILFGDQGNDLFDFSKLEDTTNSDMDIIMDFEQGQDIIDLRGLGLEYNDLSFEVIDGNVVVEDVNSDFAFELQGEHDLAANDFLF